VLKPDLVILAISQGDDIAQIALERQNSQKHETARIPTTTVRGLLSDSAKSVFPELMELTHPAKTQDASETTILGATWKEDARRVLNSATAAQRARYSRLDPEARGRFESGDLNPAMLELALQRPGYWQLTLAASAADPLVIEMGNQIGRIRDLAASHGAGFLVVVLPFPAYVSEAGMQRVSRLGFDVDPEMFRGSSADDTIRLAAQHAGLPFYTFTGQFRSAEAQGVKLYYDFDCHLNPAGSGLLASLLAPILEHSISEHTN